MACQVPRRTIAASLEESIEKRFLTDVKSEYVGFRNSGCRIGGLAGGYSYLDGVRIWDDGALGLARADAARFSRARAGRCGESDRRPVSRRLSGVIGYQNGCV